MTDRWSMIWHQAMTRSFLNGKAFGHNKTVVFTVPAPVSGKMLRIRFSNRFGTVPGQIGSMRLYAGGHGCQVTMKGQKSFEIPAGGTVYSDPCGMSVERGQDIEVRLYYKNDILDNNMIEEKASLLKGDRTMRSGKVPLKKPLPARLLGAYNGIPAIEAIEVMTEEPAKAVAAFGDSITALSRWTKPLARRLAEAYPGEYVLLNAGISGNCLLYEPGGIFGPVFGEMGVKRFDRDVLEIPNLSVVILGLGVNDVSYLNKKTAGQIGLRAYQKAVTEMTDRLHERGVRVVMQTISPRLGVSLTMGRYDRNMEELRLQINSWIRSAGIFDYVFDAEKVVREKRKDGYYYREDLQQGDHLHPNAKGGQTLADAYDLKKLTGKED